MSSVDEVLALARQHIAAGEARQLLAHQLGRPQVWQIAHGEAPLSEEQVVQFASLVARRAAGEPIAYLTGWREFYGRDFAVTPAVLIPRPETELLVELVLARAAAPAAPQLLDLGSGSGCIAITLALELPQARVTATDVSAEALAVIERNAARHGAAVELLRSDWFAALPGRRFDLIVSNPPYVAADDAHLRQGDLRFEPALALTPGADALAALRAIVAQAPAHLQAGGQLLVEHGYDQADLVRGLFAAAGYVQIEQWRDLAGIVRVTGGIRP